MAATIAFNGTLIATVEDNTGFSSVKISGTGGAPTPVSETDVIKIGSGACSLKVSKQRNILWFDIGAGNELDFTPSTGAQDGQQVFIWSLFLAAGLLLTAESVTAGGYGVALGTDTSNYSLWNRGGNDKNIPSDWKLYAQDPTKTQTAGLGTFDIASVRYFGMFADVGGVTARFENLMIDNMSYGYGLRMYGTSTVNDLIGDVLTDEITNAYGFIRTDNGIFYAHGQWLLGDNVGTNQSIHSEAGHVIVYEVQEYWIDGGSNWVSAVPTEYNQFKRVGNANNHTQLTLGDGFLLKAGKGVDGLTADVTVDLDDGHTGGTPDLTIIGAKFDEINQLLALGANSSFTMDNTIINNCIEVIDAGDGSGGIIIRDCTFQNYSGESAAVHWGGTGMDLRNSAFRNNNGGTNSAGIRHTDGTSATYYNLTFDNNDYDVYLNHASANLTINKDGTSDPVTSYSSGSGSVDFVGTVNLKVTVKDTSGAGIVDARVFMEAGDGAGSAPYYDSVSIVSTGTTATCTHSSHGLSTGQFVVIRGANENAYNGVFTITVNGASEYEYTMGSDPDDTATGTITSTQVFMNELTIAGGIAEESFKTAGAQAYAGYARKSSGSPFYKLANFSGTDISGGLDLPVQMTSDE